MTATYDNHDFPITVDLHYTNLPDPLKPDDPTEGTYDFAAAQNGDGSLIVRLLREQHSGARRVTFSRSPATGWLGARPRPICKWYPATPRAPTKPQCWNQQFQAVYTDKPWSPLEDLGDPSACPAIPSL